MGLFPSSLLLCWLYLFNASSFVRCFAGICWLQRWLLRFVWNATLLICNRWLLCSRLGSFGLGNIFFAVHVDFFQ